MGLDQYAYTRHADEDSDCNVELAYWRKHNRLHGWMENLYANKGNQLTQEGYGSSFNCVELELSEADLEQLEAHVENKSLPNTGGFFFGNDSFDWEDNDGNPPAKNDYYYKETDMRFIVAARKALQEGKKVFYNSWW